MLVPEPVKKFYVCTSKNLRRDLAEALVEFEEVHMERPEDVPGLKPPSEVSTEYLRLYSELKRSAENLIAHLGKAPEAEWTGGDLTLEEMRALPEEVDRAIGRLLEIQRELERPAKHVKRDIKKKLKEAKAKVLKDLEVLFAKVVHALGQIRGEAAVEKLESDFMLEGVELVLTQGWVPASKAEVLKEKLSSKLAGFLGIEFEGPKKEDKPPTYVRISKIFRPFRLLTHKLYGWPKSRELDPTPITTVLFSLMFGFMYGDFGHGLVLALLGLLIYKKSRSENMRDFGGILVSAGMASMLFGFLYGEAFFIHLTEHSILPAPSKDPMGLISLSLLFGGFELALAFFLQAVNKIIQGDFWGSVLEFRGFGTFFAYVAAFYAAYRNGADMTATVADPLFKLAAFIVMVTVAYPVFESLKHGYGVGEGAVEGITIFLESSLSLLSNSLSFLRLAGFAISHATFGVLAHELAAEATSTAARILPLVIFNVFGMGLEGMVSFIQALRLTFYELFTKFFSAQGRPFISVRELLG